MGTSPRGGLSSSPNTELKKEKSMTRRHTVAVSHGKPSLKRSETLIDKNDLIESEN